MTANKPNDNASKRLANLGLAALAAQSGCMTLFLVVGALLVGLWLDAQFGQRGPFTIGLLLLSIPVSLFFMVRIALGAIKRIEPPSTSKTPRQRFTHEEEE
jgi:uncharacterized membrane protein